MSAGFLTPNEIKEFQELVYKDKGIKLTEEEALDQGTRLITVIEAI